jgi:uncharacterized protein (UPF0332 family)
MPYSRELLNSALVLHRTTPETQANMRRAISTAYYALFHFLIEDACGNWIRSEQRSKLARMFDHRRMAEASRGRIKEYKASPGASELLIYSVAEAFLQLQEQRHHADYDLSDTVVLDDVEEAIGLASDAFECWELVRNEQIAQEYLFSLLFKERA